MSSMWKRNKLNWRFTYSKLSNFGSASGYTEKAFFIHGCLIQGTDTDFYRKSDTTPRNTQVLIDVTTKNGFLQMLPPFILQFRNVLFQKL